MDTIGAIQAELSSSVAASRSATLDDVGDLLVCNSSSAIVITIDSDATVGWAGQRQLWCTRMGQVQLHLQPDQVSIFRAIFLPLLSMDSKVFCRIPTKSNEWAVF